MYTKQKVNGELYRALCDAHGATGMRIRNDAIRKLRSGLYRLNMKVVLVSKGMQSSLVDVVKK